MLPFWLTKNTAFETSRNDKTKDSQTMMEKGIITFKHNSPLMFFSILCDIAGNQLLHINLTLRMCRGIAEETCKHAELLPVLR